MDPEAIAILSEHPNIIGMKDSSGNVPQLASYVRVSTEDYNVLVGTAGAWYPALALGIKAGVHALANCCPNECVKIQELGISGLKYGCDLMGFKGGYVRSPLQQISEQRKADLRKVFEKAQLI